VRQAIPRILAIAVFIAIAPCQLSAQEGLRDRDRTFEASKKIASDLQKARAHYGPFYFLSNLELTDIGYNATLFTPTTESDGALTLGIRAPQRFYFVPTKKQVYSVELTPQYAFSTSRLSDGQVGYFGRFDAQYLLNHLYLDLYGVRADEARAATSEINRLTTVREDTAGVSGEYRYSSRTSASFTAAARSYAFPSDRLQPANIPVSLLDRSQQDYRLSLNHKTFPLTSLFLTGEFSNYSFDRATYKNAHRTYAGIGATRTSGRGTMRLEAGISKLDFLDRRSPGFNGLVGNLDANYELSGRSTLSAGVVRDIEFSIFADKNNYYVSDHGNVALSYISTRRLTLRAATAVTRNRYPVATFDRFGIVHRRVDTAIFPSVGWLYSRRRFTGGFDVGYYKRVSNFDVDETDGIRVILHLSLTP
jgi:hypothetical protein